MKLSPTQIDVLRRLAAGETFITGLRIDTMTILVKGGYLSKTERFATLWFIRGWSLTAKGWEVLAALEGK